MNQTVIFKSEEGRKRILAQYDQFLAKWPVPYELHMIQTDYGETFVLQCGDSSAPPLVLLHGSTSNSAIWAGYMAKLCPHYRILTIDIPGEPGKSQPVRYDLQGPAYAEWLCQALAGLNVAKVSLMGVSLGGFMSLKFATTHPERVEKLALLCPAGVAQQKSSFLWKAILFSLLGDWGFTLTMRTLSGKGAPMHPAATAYMRLIAKEFQPRMEVLPLYSDEELKRITSPVLLVAGERDNLLPSKKTAARLQALLPNFKSVLLPEAGHMLVDCTEWVAPFFSV